MKTTKKMHFRVRDIVHTGVEERLLGPRGRSAIIGIIHSTTHERDLQQPWAVEVLPDGSLVHILLGPPFLHCLKRLAIVLTHTDGVEKFAGSRRLLPLQHCGLGGDVRHLHLLGILWQLPGLTERWGRFHVPEHTRCEVVLTRCRGLGWGDVVVRCLSLLFLSTLLYGMQRQGNACGMVIGGSGGTSERLWLNCADAMPKGKIKKNGGGRPIIMLYKRGGGVFGGAS